MAEADARNPALREPIAVLDGHAPANGGTLQGPDPTPAADSLQGARAGIDERRRSHRHLQMAEADAEPPAPREPITTVLDGCAPADGGSLQGSDPTPAADSLQGARAGAGAQRRASATRRCAPCCQPALRPELRAAPQAARVGWARLRLPRARPVASSQPSNILNKTSSSQNPSRAAAAPSE